MFLFLNIVFPLPIFDIRNQGILRAKLSTTHIAEKEKALILRSSKVITGLFLHSAYELLNLLPNGNHSAFLWKVDVCARAFKGLAILNQLHKATATSNKLFFIFGFFD